MALENENQNKKESNGRIRKLFWCAIFMTAIISVFLAIVWLKGGLYSTSLEEQFAELEQKLAIPDEENAAIIYNQLVSDFESKPFYPTFWKSEVHDTIMRKPWSGNDYPELEKWLISHQFIIDKLLEATQKEKCRFPIKDQFLEIDNNRLSTIRNLARLLMYSTNYDLENNHTTETVNKFLAIIQIGSHMCQQASTIDILTGIAIEALARDQITNLIIQGKVSPNDIDLIERKINSTINNSNWDPDIFSEFDRLYKRLELNKLNLIQKIQFKFYEYQMSMKSDYDQVEYSYLKSLAKRYGIRILIAIAKYNKNNNHWPRSLEEIKLLAPEEIFIDPINGGEFVYRLTDENFILYSKGKNNIDEGGQYNVIMLSSWESEIQEDDVLIWPLKFGEN